MATVRRHWAMITAIPLLLLAILFAVFQHELDSRKAKADSAGTPSGNGSGNVTTAPSIADPAAQRLALRNYMRVQQLRAELALGSRDLAAIGVSSGTATQILTLVKNFAASSTTAMSAADANYQAAQHALQEAVRSVNVGTTDGTALASLSTLNQNVTAAAARRLGVMAPLVTQIMSLLTSDQQAIWQAAQANAMRERTPGGTPAPGTFRYVSDLTDDQIQQLDQSVRQNGGAAALASAPQLLNSMQIQQAQTAISNQRIAMAAVATAEVAILPMPDLLKRPPRSTTRPAHHSLPPLQSP